ncbi:Squalene/phytoene synthase-domain-containing protein [Kockovaella imperatae]|uniref:Bifunctional lycopene cyclase/phytoene synthase n=1 Tax=Kockovaella imperatae TaxID=4999 RepID=A0A1Y1U6U7_9TREE|nr:Squalene/phytoene synthase-domain-containing protein [Kockovaella imperatae]ORX33738.1 Squalene/phytoene synthase-domain-containing protein [Kockovaella imperatae]
MLYRQVLLYFLIPPILVFGALYRPLLGRRDVIKILWLAFMATLWTTPWDNWIISQAGWDYPPDSILGRLWLVPFEEHAFFILQPIFLILLHAICTHHRLLPFDFDSSSKSPALIRSSSRSSISGPSSPLRTISSPSLKSSPSRQILEGDYFGSPAKGETVVERRSLPRRSLQTLPRRPMPSLLWLGLFIFGLNLVGEAHFGLLENHLGLLGVGRRAFYLGWILVWISPVIGFLTWLGARLTQSAWISWIIGSGFLCVVDTIGIRSGAWSISLETSVGFEVVRGLPLEEFVFFLLTSYLVILSSSLITHLHTLLILSPSLPPCPPLNPISHITLLASVALRAPHIDINVLNGLRNAEETLKRGSKSFSVAKLAFSREMRIGLVAMYSWCRVTDNLIDDPIISDTARHSEDTLHRARIHILESLRKHLEATYTAPYPNSISTCDGILDTLPNLTQANRSAFRLFSAIIPRLVPIDPFLELCDGYETDTRFVPVTDLGPGPSVSAGEAQVVASSTAPSPLKAKLASQDVAHLERYLPIKTTKDLLGYADDVAGSIAAAICYLSWSILDTPANPAHSLTPISAHLAWSDRIHRPLMRAKTGNSPEHDERVWVVEKSREMGRALQLVNIARDIAKDAVIGRVYVPLSSFASASDLLDVLFPRRTGPSPKYAAYSMPLLHMADQLRASSEGAINKLPRTARGGTRAMAASYFEIGTAIRAQDGHVDERGVKVSKWKRAGQAARAMWLG